MNDSRVLALQLALDATKVRGTAEASVIVSDAKAFLAFLNATKSAQG